MANFNVEWKKTGLISLFEEAQFLGFDVRKFDSLQVEVQASLKKVVVSRVIKIIEKNWNGEVDNLVSKGTFREVKNGVYIISIGRDFGVRYKNGCSEIMYIGRGNISNRLRSHLQNWIFDMSRSLRDIPFKFYMEEFRDGRSPDAFKDCEHWLLDQFTNKFGEQPLLNKIAGREGSIEHNFGGNCRAPLDGRKKFLWELRPSARNEWFKPVSDE